MAEIQQFLSPEEEIKKLEQQLEEKKRALTQGGEQAPEEKEMFREVLKEHIETLRPSPPAAYSPPQISLPPVAVPSPGDTSADAKKHEADEATIRMLVEKAMIGTVEDAVKAAEKISPYMLDELHDHLIDDVYDKLVALRKVKVL